MPNVQSLIHFLPELILSAGSILVLILSLFNAKKVPFVLSLIFIAAAGIFSFLQFNIGNPPLFWGLIIVDKMAVFFKLLFIATAFLITIFASESREIESDRPEFYSLILASVVGMSILVQANNILIIYLGLEFVSLISYILVGYVKGSKRSSEAAIKYLLFGAIASGFFLYGSSIFYGQTGSLYLTDFIKVAPYGFNIIAGILILAGFLYKIAAVPMQAWCPDAYEGAPTPVTSFLSIAPKAAGFAILIRVIGFIGINFNWQIVIAVISAATMTFGNLAAIPQNNLKRLLAYSSIAHAGYLLIGVATLTPKGVEAVYFYFIAYFLMNLGAFLVVQIIEDKFGSEDIETYKGLGRRGGCGVWLGIIMTIFLLSLTGVPPFVGFIGKFYVFSAAIDAKLYWLAMIGIANSVVSLYYYMRIVKALFFDEPKEVASQFVLEKKTLTVFASILAILVLVLGLMWQPLSVIVSSVIQ